MVKKKKFRDFTDSRGQLLYNEGKIKIEVTK